MKLYLINKGELVEIKNPVFSTGDVYLLDDEKTRSSGTKTRSNERWCC
jgi:hypothetical protein